MRCTFKHILSFVIFISIFSSCSRKKDKFLNRNWHSLNTKYNVLYNGNLALKAGLKEIEESYKDNYWEILPVERLSISDEFSTERENYNLFMQDTSIIENELLEGAKKASLIADRVLSRVRKNIGY